MRSALLGLCVSAVSLCAAERAAEFNRDVRPILSDKCFTCHGPDAKTKNIPLRLDLESAAKADLGGGRRAIVEGDPDTSELIRRVTTESKAKRMPPVHTGHAIAPKEVEALRSWIAAGAKWEKHWSFLPPRAPALPKVSNAAWVRNPIDAFVLERLDREGLRPSPEAGKEALLRRATLDLTGLPPAPAEIDAFLADSSPNAYERAVDRLLASPRYAERMAYRWLDYARYSDTNGYQFDGERSMWRWRDWVIEAFARNKPYDRFTLEQIAGDMLPGATTDQKVATGFNRNHRGNSEFGIIAEEYAVEYVIDRMETTSAVFMGLTMGCARCHNHKYDPIAQREFYQMYAYFNNVPEHGRAMKYGNSPPLTPAPTEEQQAQARELNAKIAAIEKWIEARGAQTRREMAAWSKTAAAGGQTLWAPDSGRERNLKRIVHDIEDRFSVSARVSAESAPNGAIWTRTDNSPRGRGYGLYARQGKLMVHFISDWDDDAIRITSKTALAGGRAYNVLVTYSGSRMAEGIHVYVDGAEIEMEVKLDTLYRPLGNAGKAFKEVFRIGEGGGAENKFNGVVEDVAVYSRVVNGDEIAALASTKPSLLYFLENAAAPEVRGQWAKLTQLRREREALERSFPTVMVMAELKQRRPTHLLQRGQYDKPGEVVEPGVPALLHPLPAGAPNNRLGFAQWLIAPENPLTARVGVNRFWQMMFGIGLVKTVEDFGLQGEWPSHPELLDWMSTEFVRSGWDVKGLLKLMVTSATYRQDSRATPELLQSDPENRLLARGARFRVPAESVRDTALAVAGLLDARIGGPSVKPYQPDGLWKELTMQDMDYAQAHGRDLYRRSLYTFWKRTVAPPMLANFDAANREACVVRESRTNTPLQALNLMNDVQFVEAARVFGQRMMLEGGASAEERLRYGFRLATGRVPKPAEVEVLRGSLNYHLDYFAGDAKRVEQFLAQGEAPIDARVDKRELAAFGSVGSLLLNLDETVTRQ
ncbi:MAG: DUF1553 domain-containing protein [Acidobacteria bacterium]|nr:DUF1553 domain-containing protein [Acidobacteriota bacterium]